MASSALADRRRRTRPGRRAGRHRSDGDGSKRAWNSATRSRDQVGVPGQRVLDVRLAEGEADLAQVLGVGPQRSPPRGRSSPARSTRRLKPSLSIAPSTRPANASRTSAAPRPRRARRRPAPAPRCRRRVTPASAAGRGTCTAARRARCRPRWSSSGSSSDSAIGVARRYTRKRHSPAGASTSWPSDVTSSSPPSSSLGRRGARRRPPAPAPPRPGRRRRRAGAEASNSRRPLRPRRRRRRAAVRSRSVHDVDCSSIAPLEGVEVDRRRRRSAAAR